MLITGSKSYVEERVTVEAAECDDCKKRVEHNWGDPFVINLGTNHEPFPKMLSLSINGGYQSFYNGPKLCVLLCEECAEKLLTAFPYFRQIINDPQYSQVE